MTEQESPVRAEGEQESTVYVRGLVKSYSGRTVLAGVDLDVRPGEILALLGPNGAGKTTTIEILEGYRTRDRGEVLVLGVDPARHRNRIKSRVGIVAQSTGVEPYLTVAETVTMYASFYQHPRPVGEVIGLTGLTAERDARVSRLSGGQQRKLDVAIALAGDPDLLFLDEPTTGFDPSARREAWELIRNLAGLGKTVLLTTHYMDEARHLADRVAIITAGRIVADGPPATLGNRDEATARIRYRLPTGSVVPADLNGLVGRDGFTTIEVRDATSALYRLTSWAVERGISLEGLEVTRPTLEEVYLALTGATTPDSDGTGRREDDGRTSTSARRWPP